MTKRKSVGLKGHPCFTPTEQGTSTDGLAVQVEGHLQVHVHALDDVNEVTWYTHLG
jgi:hypothetical protein